MLRLTQKGPPQKPSVLVICYTYVFASSILLLIGLCNFYIYFPSSSLNNVILFWCAAWKAHEQRTHTKLFNFPQTFLSLALLLWIFFRNFSLPYLLLLNIFIFLSLYFKITTLYFTILLPSLITHVNLLVVLSTTLFH